MRRRKLPYAEGDWFAVPLTNGGYGLGLAARLDGSGGLLGYFFWPRHANVPTENDTTGLTADNAILIERFGHIGLIDGDWTIVCKTADWNRGLWPLPDFGRVATASTPVALRVTYDETTLTQIREVYVPTIEALGLPQDCMSGSRAVEIGVGQILERLERANQGGFDAADYTVEIPRREVPYDLGDWFAVPIGHGKHALGLLTRASRSGIMFAYFFILDHAGLPIAADTPNLRSSDSILVAMCGDIGILKGEWPIVRKSSNWQRELWPFPQFGWIPNESEPEYLRVLFNEVRLEERIVSHVVTEDEFRTLPDITIYGYKQMEAKLASTINSNSS